jgi:hypothetical protein
MKELLNFFRNGGAPAAPAAHAAHAAHAAGDARDWNTVTYGQWNSKIYSSAYIADVKEWLLDEDECLTEYDVLQKLRQQHNDN